MDDETLLAVIHRGRPATVPALATLAHLSDDDAQAAVGRLRGRRLLGGTGDELTYPHPATWAAEAVSRRTGELRRASEEALSDLESVVADLPAMLRHWSVGEVSAELVPVDTRHGPHASEDLWFDTARHDVGTLNAVLPDVARFLSSTDERSIRFAQALRGKEAVRVIIPADTVNDPKVVQSMQHFGSAGVQYRLLTDPPSWFWVDGDQLALPFEWGEGRPTSVLGLRHPSLAALALAYFDGLWSRAAPAAAPGVPGQRALAGEPWTPLLMLMRQGTTLETASRMLGINPRTGRRRIAAAMTHYGVSTLFALGVAWAAELPAAVEPAGGRAAAERD
ncbi:hypothetical protein C5B96_15880 [Subtercola sp. Z020]|uniref:hypothetical protein n=1 Tax=Subtercola sp. Z020 TaxID=2080582 RepID=UPI000CE7E572|nr:hypothetical protein [Subtercola sp. Z020]PPF77350.1 hypothetical protein C5B96_15880 [Subtercola sp. Z020]